MRSTASKGRGVKKLPGGVVYMVVREVRFKGLLASV
jgi:hypothetical protein